MKSLPARPSLESLRKQAKKLAREFAAGDAAAIARARAHLPSAGPPLTQRNAQLVIAREYGYAGWQDLTADVHRRLGDGLEWAGRQAERAIHDNDIEGLTQLLAEHPALLSWRGPHGDGADGGLVRFATGSFGDSFDPVSEEHFTRRACAELLIDAGAVVTPAVYEGILDARARGLLQLFDRKGLLPRTLGVFAALGDLDAVRSALDDPGSDLAAVNEAFVRACGFQHEDVAFLLLQRSIALDAELGQRVDQGPGRRAFLRYFMEKRPAHATSVGLWKAFVMEHVKRSVLDDDLTAFVRAIDRDAWLLDDAHVSFQVETIETSTLHDREQFILALLDREPAVLRRQPPPPSQAIEFAATYAHTRLIPLLERIWPLPDDLPYSAAVGDLTRVRRWFDESGNAALGDIEMHYPYNDPRARGNLQWNPPSPQQVLDTALAYAVINRHFDVADFLLEHGADIDTDWSSHEPASILHELVFHANYESMRFLIDRGIDMTILDYRWNATAEGWARYAAHDERMAQWLAEAERQRDRPDATA